MPIRQFRYRFRVPASGGGFGLVELMITIAMIAVLTAIALPSYSYMIRGNRIVTQTNDLLSAFNYARNESITRSRGVTLCAADTTAGTPGGCGDAGDWSKGWMVFIDDTAVPTDPPPVAIDGANVLRTWVGIPQNLLTADGDQAFIRFNPRGMASSNPDPDVVFTLKPVSDCSNQQQRSIAINALGRSSSSKVDCT
jgi:type IV fimbrial biogenesis protein FimT